MEKTTAISAGRGHYFVTTARDDYYTKGGEPLGRWDGEGAAELGLTGEVDGKVFKRMMAGLSPDGDERWIKRQTYTVKTEAGEKHRTPCAGYDLQFSDPKSVTAFRLLCSQETRQKVDAIRDQALSAALQIVQEEGAFCRTKRRDQTIERLPTKLIIAKFEHRTSRELDPHAHVHCVVMNMGKCDDGKWRSVDGKPFFELQKRLWMVYDAELSKGLEETLGLKTSRDGLSFRVNGVPEELCQFWSKRREQIKEAMVEYGSDGAGREMAALRTRSAKKEVPAQELHARWKEEAERFGFREKDAEALVRGPREKFGEEWVRAQVFQKALFELTKRESTFRERQFLETVARESQTLCLGALQKEAREFLKASPNVARIETKDGEKRYTIPELWKVEHKFTDELAASKSDRSHKVRETTILAAIEKTKAEKGFSLTAEQEKALRHITERDGAIQCVEGWAGTGKTTMLSAARMAWERQGFTVIGCAVAGQAATRLEKEAGIKSQSLAYTLCRLEKGGPFEPHPSLGRKLYAEWKYATWGMSGKAKAKYLGEYYKPTSKLKHEFLYATHQISKNHKEFLNKQLEERRFDIGKKTVLVVDECSMCDTRQLSKLQTLARDKGAKLVYLGDRAQLQAINQGGAFREAVRVVGRAELRHIIRQRKEEDREAVTNFREKDTQKALSSYAARGLLYVGASSERTLRKAVSDWAKGGGLEAPKDHLLLAGTNEQVRTLNHLAQLKAKDAGILSHKSISVHGERIHEGERVMFTKRSQSLTVENGWMGEVTRVNTLQKTATVRLDEDGRSVTVRLRDYDCLTLSYAMTTHKAQGASLENVYIVTGGRMQDRHMSYVQASRAKDTAKFYTTRAEAGDNLEKLSQQMNKDREKVFAHEHMRQEIKEKDLGLERERERVRERN